MKQIKQLLNLRFSYILGILSFILYSLSFLIGYEEEAANHLFLIIKAGLIFMSALLFLLSCRNDSSERIKIQFSILNFFILIYQLLLLLAVGKTILYIRDYPSILNSIMWISCSVFSILRFRNELQKYILALTKDHLTVILSIVSLIISVLVIILSSEPSGVRFTWDSDTLYGFIYGLDFESLYNAKLMTFHSHVSIVYAHLLVLFKLLFGNLRFAFFILNAICIIAASFGMTFLLKELIPGKKPLSYALGSTIFLLSPWVCGLSTYHMYDYYIWCLFPLLIYFYSRKNRIGFLVLGVMITFSKASGLVVFGSVCTCIFITDIIHYIRKEETFSLKSTIVRMFFDINYWFFASVAFVFFLFFKYGIAEVTQFEDTEFGLNPRHVAHLLKLYSTANFLWLFVLLTTVLIVCVFIRKNITISDNSRNVLIVVLFSDLIFILFNCLCITYRLPRYMNSHISVVYICSVLLLLCIDSSKAVNTFMALICALSLISSFRMIDPVSLSLFKTINVGDHRIVDFEMTEDPSLEDSIVCNREYYSYEILLDKALSYVINDRNESDEILFSLGNQDITWGFSGGRYSYGIGDNKHYFELFYDKSIAGLANGYDYEYYNSPDMIPFEIHYIFPQETIEDATNSSPSSSFYYIYMPTMNAGKEQKISGNFAITDSKEFLFRGWKMNVIKFNL